MGMLLSAMGMGCLDPHLLLQSDTDETLEACTGTHVHTGINKTIQNIALTNKQFFTALSSCLAWSLCGSKQEGTRPTNVGCIA